MTLESSLALKSWDLLTCIRPWDTASWESTHWLSPGPHLTMTLGCSSPIHNSEDTLLALYSSLGPVRPSSWQKKAGILKELLPSSCSPQLSLSIRPGILLACLVIFRTWVLAEPRQLEQCRKQRPQHTFVPLTGRTEPESTGSVGRHCQHRCCVPAVRHGPLRPSLSSSRAWGPTHLMTED